MSDTIYVKGLDALQKLLDTLPAKMEKNIMRSALRVGANVVKAEAQQQLASNGNVKTGLLSKGLKVSTNAKRGTITASVKSKGKHGYIARWIEYGTATHMIKPKKAKVLSFEGVFRKSIEHPGIKPMPFLRPALDNKTGAAVVAVGEAIKAKLDKAGLDTADIEIDEV